ncbi:hypothetical protein HOLleu_03126 [Holothuria leucospilota]|uniref:Integrase catalytic domain-containing protein n=1 Tax=Holothuria leucospilota TaxID=206669 RepID=A0A9Q1CQE7_HOLLE|nr:hypothetical protein HOLleu_03126 [Holothuria leucospilota]
MTKQTEKLPDILRSIYYDASHPAGYRGIAELLRHARKRRPNTTREEVERWLRSEDTYTLHRPVRRKYERNRVYVHGIDDQWQADLVDVTALSRHNRGIRFLLTCIDIFSKYAWVVPVKDKKGTTIVKALETILVRRRPRKLQTDKGSEFFNKDVKRLLTSHDVHLFATHNETKASVVERFNRTFKEKMWKYLTANNTLRYLETLPRLVESYNTGYHRSIGRSPVDVSDRNELEVWNRLYPDLRRRRKSRRGTRRPMYRFDVGDRVRLSMNVRHFRKGYLPRWTEEIFTVYKRIPRKPVVYTLKDWDVPPTQTVIERGSWEKINPIAGLSIPYEFEISGTGDQYIDLEETQVYVKCKITKSGGGAIDLDAASNPDKVGPINYTLHSLFKQVDVSLNGQEISDSSSMYPYRAYLEALLNYGEESKSGQLSSALYYHDTPGKLALVNPSHANGNKGLKARAQFFDGSHEVELMGRLHCDVFHMNRYLMNGVNVKVKFTPSHDEFVLCSSNASPAYKMKITEIALYARRVTPSPTVLLQHAKILASGVTAKYPIQRVQMKTKSIQAGTTNVVTDHLWLGQLPRRLIFGFVLASSFNGDYGKNPFEFKHCKISNLTLRYAGQLYPSDPMRLDFADDGESSTKTLRGYDSLFTALHKKGLNEDFGISRDDYENGYTLFGFDFTPDRSDGAHYNRKQEGSLDLSIRFKEALAASVILICYAEFDNIIEIDKHGNVSFDFVR